MKRLTMRNDNGMAFWVDQRCSGGGYRMSEDKEDQKRLDRLAAYEDTGLAPEEIIDLQRAWDMYGGEEGITALLTKSPNAPLTLEELREMDGEPVYIKPANDSHIESGWALVHREWCGCKTASGCAAFFERYGESWLAYRRKPEEGSHAPSDPAVPNWAKHLQSRFLRAE